MKISSWSKLKVNYWEITKCASSTMKTHLYEIENNQSFNHKKETAIHSPKYIKYISKRDAELNGYFNYSVIRNPYKRFVSMYTDLILSRPKRGIAAGLNPDMTIDDLLDFISKSNTLDIHLQPQINFISLDITLFDLDDLHRSWNLNFPYPKVVKHRSKNKVQILLSQKQKNRVYKIYKEDFIKLNYEK